VTFVLPTQPLGAKSTQLSEIGKRFIVAGLNYEDVLKSIIGEVQAYSMNPKVTEEEFISLMTKCNVGQLTDDQRFAL
jgi:hypothetical protein